MIEVLVNDDGHDEIIDQIHEKMRGGMEQMTQTVNLFPILSHISFFLSLSLCTCARERHSDCEEEANTSVQSNLPALIFTHHIPVAALMSAESEIIHSHGTLTITSLKHGARFTLLCASLCSWGSLTTI